jgi:hypothetical protein
MTDSRFPKIVPPAECPGPLRHESAATTPTMTQGNLAMAEAQPSHLPDTEWRDYSIQVSSEPGLTICAGCRMEFDAEGPTGFSADEAICPSCLVSGSERLGLTLILAAAAREFVASTSRTKSSDEYWKALDDLGADCKRFLADSSEPKRLLYERWMKKRAQKEDS